MTGTTPSRLTLTTELFREVSRTDRSTELVAVGLALHHLTELVQDEISPVELHRATAVLTKQLVQALDAPQPLVAIAELVTDPRRVATVDGRTAAELCGDSWPAVRDLAADRAVSAIEGADTFGEATVLHLAATRAVHPNRVWWDTAGWERRVEAWAALNDPEGRLRDALLTDPEHADGRVLRELVDADDVTAAA